MDKAGLNRRTKKRKSKINNLKSLVMKAIVIGASTGGPKALETLLTSLPVNLSAVIIVLQHLPFQFTTQMAIRMSNKAGLLISQMGEGDVLLPGHIYIAPGEEHFFLTYNNPPGERLTELRAHLLPAPELTRPSIDMGFTSVAEHFGPETIGVVLTGMGEDGMIGSKAIKQVGGHVIIQDEESSAVYGMPRAVQIAGYADEVLPLEQIAGRLVELT